MGQAGRSWKRPYRTQDETEKRLGKLLSKEKMVTYEWYLRMAGERPWGKWTQDYFTEQFAQLSLEITSLQGLGSADGEPPLAASRW